MDARSGGGPYPSATIVIKDRIFIPVPDEIRASFVPRLGQRKRFKVRADILRTEAEVQSPPNSLPLGSFFADVTAWRETHMEITEDQMEWATVHRMREMLVNVHDKYKVTHTYALFTTILCWVMQRIRSSGIEDLDKRARYCA